MCNAIDKSASADMAHSSDTARCITRKSASTVAESHQAVNSSPGNTVPNTQAGRKSPQSCVSNARSAVATPAAVTVLPPSNLNNKSSPSKQTKQPKLSTPYVYTAIKDIKSGTTVNVYGVVKYVRPASRTRGPGIH